MNSKISRVTQKGQATIPAEIRKNLHIKAGDSVIFIWQSDTVTLKKATPIDMQHLAAINATVGEWGSAEDDNTFANWR
jgi:AbrB family looped-hinge helix DNA binding protein